MHSRFQVPKYVQIKLNLEPNQILQVQINTGAWGGSQTFLSKITKDGRIIIPKLIMDLINSQKPTLDRQIIEVTLRPA
jgi:bifunctional DNA-binding transcriptional regulator/antitoxin component of YhaV-PrlF toxin-antitoxin module